MGDAEHATARALRRVAGYIERGEWSPGARRLVGRELLGARDDDGCRVPGPLLVWYNERAREGDSDNGATSHTLRVTLERLGDLLRHGLPAPSERSGYVGTLREAAALFGGDDGPEAPTGQGAREPEGTAPTGQGTLFAGDPPGNIDLRDLIVLLDANNGKPSEERLSQIDVARGMLNNDPDDQKAKSLLSQVRRLKRAGKINLT